MTKMEIRAAVERLIESNGSDADARATVAEYSGSIDPEGVEVTLAVPKGGGSFTGYTQEAGSVQVDDDKESTSVHTLGDRSHRIGLYKLTKISRPHDLIIIDYFWKSSQDTMSASELHPQWALKLDAKRQPQWFGERGQAVVFSLGSFRILRDWYLESWGEKIGRKHKGRIQLKIGVQY